MHFLNVGSNLSTDTLIYMWKDGWKRQQLDAVKARNWQQYKCPSINLWYIHVVEYYTVVKNFENEIAYRYLISEKREGAGQSV